MCIRDSIGAVESRPVIGPDELERHGIDLQNARVRARKGVRTIRRVWICKPVAAGSAVIKDQQVPCPRQAFRDDVRMVLSDNLTDGSELLRFAEVGTKPPDNLAVASHNSDKAGLPAADDDVAGSEPLVSPVKPLVRSHISGRVDM